MGMQGVWLAEEGVMVTVTIGYLWIVQHQLSSYTVAISFHMENLCEFGKHNRFHVSSQRW